jgi:hypothetical protein
MDLWAPAGVGVMSRDKERVWDVIIFNEVVRRRRRKRAARPRRI